MKLGFARTSSAVLAVVSMTALGFVATLGAPRSVGAALIKPTLAGPESHGSEVVFCKDAPPALLDFYHAQLPTFGASRTVVNIDRMSREDVLKLIRARLEGTAFRDQFEHAVQAVGLVENWISTPLKDEVPAKEPYVLRIGCTKQTLSARQGKTVFIDPLVAAQSTEGQLGLLGARVALSYFGERKEHLQTFEKVRALTRALLTVTPDPKLIRQAITDLGGAIEYYDIYRGATYISQKDGSQIVFAEAGVDHVNIVKTLSSESQRIERYTCQQGGKLCWTGVGPEPQVLISPADAGERIVIYRAGTQSPDPDAPNAGEIFIRSR